MFLLSRSKEPKQRVILIKDKKIDIIKKRCYPIDSKLYHTNSFLQMNSNPVQTNNTTQTLLPDIYLPLNELRIKQVTKKLKISREHAIEIIKADDRTRARQEYIKTQAHRLTPAEKNSNYQRSNPLFEVPKDEEDILYNEGYRYSVDVNIVPATVQNQSDEPVVKIELLPFQITKEHSLTQVSLVPTGLDEPCIRVNIEPTPTPILEVKLQLTEDDTPLVKVMIEPAAEAPISQATIEEPRVAPAYSYSDYYYLSASQSSLQDWQDIKKVVQPVPKNQVNILIETPVDAEPVSIKSLTDPFIFLADIWFWCFAFLQIFYLGFLLYLIYQQYRLIFWYGWIKINFYLYPKFVSFTQKARRKR